VATTPLIETLRPLYEYLLDRDTDEPGLRFWAGVLAEKEAKMGRPDALKEARKTLDRAKQ
jgi:hypothetical protein